MADTITGGAGELDSTKVDILAAIIQKEIAAKAKLAMTGSDFSSLATKGTKKLLIPKYSSFTVQERVCGSPGDATALVADNDAIDLDIVAYVAWLIDTCDEVQSGLPAQLLNAQRAAAAQGRFFDSKFVGVLEAAGVATTTVGDPTYDIIVDMKTELCERFADPGSLIFIAGCQDMGALLKDQDIKDAGVFGRPNMIDGALTMVAGVPVVECDQLAQGSYYMYSKEAVGYAFQQSPNMSSQGANEYGSLSKRVAMDQLFGIDPLQVGEGGVGGTESAWIIKDNNV